MELSLIASKSKRNFKNIYRQMLPGMSSQTDTNAPMGIMRITNILVLSSALNY